MSIITLTTDLGTKDHKVASIKGSILSLEKNVPIVDITHHIEPHDIIQTAYIVRNSYSHFPKGSIHMIAVDCFYHKDRKFLVLEANGHYFIMPDNGLFSLIFPEKKPEKIYEISHNASDDDRIFTPIDIFVPVAVHLHKGNKAKLIGKTYRGGLNMRSYIEEIYNDKGDLIDEKIEDYFPDAPAFMADIKVRKTYKYQYNSDGKVAEKEFYSDSLKELRGRVSYKYNAKGQIGETTQQFRDKEDDSKWAAVENWKYEYNDKGFLSRKILNNGQEFYDYEYSYDSQGNYLTQSEYKTTPEKSKTLTKTVERTIEYY